MFEKHDIWERHQGCVVIHRIFRDLDTGLYHLQQSEAVTLAESRTRTVTAEQFALSVDLFLDEPPSMRATGYKTVPEAIAAHWREFERPTGPRTR
ncbi:hypothetical protein [Sinorhizobium arboris]|uniref:hypothetical protein n=1 Tax=Sinorhizobium arboris TaxID=76745 RepID=UPI0004869500|nr:hypothetical protein [Sinorhizobium arboris]